MRKKTQHFSRITYALDVSVLNSNVKTYKVCFLLFLLNYNIVMLNYSEQSSFHYMDERQDLILIVLIFYYLTIRQL